MYVNICTFEFLFSTCGLLSAWENVHRLSERLPLLGVMGGRFKAILKPLGTILTCCSRVFREGVLSWTPHDVERCQSLLVVVPVSIASYTGKIIFPIPFKSNGI